MLTRNINNNENIKGLFLGGTEVKQTIFADDASFTLDGSEKSFTELIKTLDNFATTSGLKLNKSKCTALKMGTLKYSTRKWCNSNVFTWSSDQASTLGITFTNDKKTITSTELNTKN